MIILPPTNRIKKNLPATWWDWVYHFTSNCTQYSDFCTKIPDCSSTIPGYLICRRNVVWSMKSRLLLKNDFEMVDAISWTSYHAQINILLKIIKQHWPNWYPYFMKKLLLQSYMVSRGWLCTTAAMTKHVVVQLPVIIKHGMDISHRVPKSRSDSSNCLW